MRQARRATSRGCVSHGKKSIPLSRQQAENPWRSRRSSHHAPHSWYNQVMVTVQGRMQLTGVNLTPDQTYPLASKSCGHDWPAARLKATSMVSLTVVGRRTARQPICWWPGCFWHAILAKVGYCMATNISTLICLQLRHPC